MSSPVKTQLCLSLALILVAIQQAALVTSQYSDGFANEVEQQDLVMEMVHMSPSNCSRSECLVVGMQRYSEPRCEPLAREGDYCRPKEAAQDVLLNYPNKYVDARSIYTLFCPCTSGLKCQGTCKRRRNWPSRTRMPGWRENI